MSVWGRRESYGAVAATVTFWALISAVTTLTRPLIPADENPVMSAAESDYLKLAAHQRIRWRPETPEAFIEARRLGKPILLAIGAAWSSDARRFDQQVFSELEVAERINREFIPVRIDLVENPGWQSLYLPIVRSTIAGADGFQLYAIRPDGSLVSWLNQPHSSGKIDEIEFLSRLVEVRRALASKTETAAGREQAVELRRLETDASVASPEIGAYVQGLVSRIDAKAGGFDYDDRVLTWPLAEWNLLMSAARTPSLESSVTPRLRSTMINWLDGGIFESMGTGGEQYVRTSVITKQSADAMLFFAAYEDETGDRLAGLAARRAFDYLDRLFDQGMAAYLHAPVLDNHRSPRYSVPRRRLVEALPPEERLWAQNSFGLTVGWNPQLIPYARQAAPILAEPDRALMVLAQILAEAPAGSFDLGTQTTLDVSATVVSRMIATALILGDDARLQRALAHFERLAEFRVGGSDVIHGKTADGLPRRYLVDYLAYVDACLATYIATGKIEFLNEARTVMRRALSTFKRNRRLVTADLSDTGLPDGITSVPQLTDDWSPSSVSTAMGLCHALSAIENSRDNEFVRAASHLMVSMAPVANDLSRGVAGYFLASLRVRADRVLLTVGPDARALAARLAYRDASLAVFPLTGDRRPDVQAMGPGIYVARADSVLGPISMSQAVGLLNAASAE